MIYRSDDNLTDAEVSRLFRERIAARMSAITDRLAPAGDVAASPPDVPTLGAPAPAGASPCTGADRTADASGGRVAGVVARAAPSAPVSPHAEPVGGAGTYFDDGTAWGEESPAPVRRRVHPLSLLGALLALALVALMMAAAGVAIESMANAFRGK